jgi:hypothetical protein
MPGFALKNPPPRDRYPADAEKVIAEALTERLDWINVSPTAIASAAMTALYDAGFQVMGHRRSVEGGRTDRVDALRLDGGPRR